MKYQDQLEVQEQDEILDVTEAAKHTQRAEPRNRFIPHDFKAEGTDEPMPRPAHIQVPEIAYRLGVGRLKVYAMLEAGLIPGIRFGRKWIITRFAYEAWERTCGVRASSAEVQ